MFHISHMFQTLTYTRLSISGRENIQLTVFLPLIHRKYHLQGSFYMTASALSCTHAEREKVRENLITSQPDFHSCATLSHSLSQPCTHFPLHHKTPHPHKHLHTLQLTTHPLTVGEGLEEHLFAVGAVASYSAGPHLDHVAGPRFQTLQNHIRRFA